MEGSMKIERSSGAGRVPNVTDVHVVALYDPSTGDIVHAHSVTVLEGGRPISEREAVEAAKTAARRAGHSIEALEVKTSKSLEHGLTPHRIDLKSGEFVSVEMPKRTVGA
jgi:hypothetical protein